MEITQQADYAVRAVLELALQPPGARLSCEAIARRHTIPLAFLTKICARLTTEGILRSQRGVNGGVQLARPADEINLLEVVEAIDGPITFNRCNRKPSECARSRTCVVHPIWAELCSEFRARLASYDFATIAASARSTSTLQTIQLCQGV
jgi:Rrf2 family transcriptional regulator, iron-sulfur cluster assembly transcription factor